MAGWSERDEHVREVIATVAERCRAAIAAWQRVPLGPILAALLLVAFLVRLAPLGRYVTPDEPAWVLRSIQFGDALASHDWAAVPVTGHPGVTTMWLGALGVAVRRALAPASSELHLQFLRNLAWFSPENGAAQTHLAAFLGWGRVAVAAVTTLGLALLYLLLARLAGRRAALLGVGLLACDPFLVGHSGLLHTDALLATFSLLALVCAVWALCRQVGWVDPEPVVPTPVPPPPPGPEYDLRARLRLALWLLRGALPESLTRRVKLLHVEPVRGQLSYLDLSYDLAWGLWALRWLRARLSQLADRIGRAKGFEKVGWLAAGAFTGLALLTKTPAALLFIFMGLAAWWGARTEAQRRAELPSERLRWFARSLALNGGLLLAAALAVVFALYPALWVSPAGVVRTLAGFAGQHLETAQRPIFFLGRTSYTPGPFFYPLVGLWRISGLALIGLALGLVRLRRLEGARRWAVLFLLAFALVFGLAITLAAKKHDRYLLPALVGVTAVAALAAGPRIERHATSLVALQLLILLPVVGYPLTGFNSLLGGQLGAVGVLDVDWGEGMGAAARWLNRQAGAGGRADAARMTVAAASEPSFAPLFAGSTVGLAQVSLADYIVAAPGASAETAGMEVARTILIEGVRHAVIYTNTRVSEQAAYLAARAGPADLILLDAETPLARRYSGPGLLVAASDLPDPAALVQRLAAWGPETGGTAWLVADPAATEMAAALARQGLECVGRATLSATVGGAAITRYELRAGAPLSIALPTATFGEGFRLVAALLPEAPTEGPFGVALRWQALAPLPADLSESLYLRDAAGHAWAEVGAQIVDGATFPTSSWVEGAWADTKLTLTPPPLIPPGDYHVELTVTDEAGAQLGATDAAAQFRGVRFDLGQVAILPPPSPAGPLPCAAGQSLQAGVVVACVEEVAESHLTLLSGDSTTLVLTWWATARPGSNYRVRWRLLDSAGSPGPEQEMPLSLYATSRWRPGDSFVVRYRVRADPTLPAGRYTLALTVLDSNGAVLGPQDRALTTVEVLDRARDFELPATMAHPLNLTFSDGVLADANGVLADAGGARIYLRGFDLTPDVLRRGERLTVTLIWQADGPTDLDYTVFVHLLGPDGRLYGQADQAPAGGAAPTSSWAPGQVVTDTLTIRVATDAPAGHYILAAGMYDTASGRRLEVSDAAGQRMSDERAQLPVELALSGGEE